MISRQLVGVRVVFAVVVLLGPLVEGFARASTAVAATPTTFSGQASALTADVLGVVTNVADTGALPPAGGTLNSSQAPVSIPGLVTAIAASATSSGAGTESQSTASMVSPQVSVATLIDILTAGLVQTTATATCNGTTPAVSASSTVAGLTVLGVPITVTGAANQTITLPLGLGSLVINEQTSTANSITVTGLHLTITAIADVEMATSEADITCGSTPPPPSPSFSGQGTAYASAVDGVTTTAGDTGPLPAVGGSLSSSSGSVNLPGQLAASAASATSNGAGNQSQSTAAISGADVTVSTLLHIVTAGSMQTTATATCTGTTPAVSASTSIAALTLLGAPVIVTGAADQTITLPLGLGTLVVNQQVSTANSITVTGVHLDITGIGTVDLARSEADINCQPPPPPPPAAFSGEGTAYASNTLGVATTVADTGPLPAAGGSLSSSLVTLNLPGQLTASAASSTADGAGAQSQSTASLANANVSVSTLVSIVTAGVLETLANASCSGSTPSVSASSIIAGLTILGVPITVTGAVDQTITLPMALGTVVLNQQVSTADSITVTGVHLVLNGFGTVDLARSEADITCALAPPTISKAFGVTTLPFGQNTTLSFTVANPNAAQALNGVGFTDTLPAGLTVATPNGLGGSCGGGTITAASGSVSLSGATLAPSSSCMFSVNVTAVAVGAQVNTTSAVTSTNGGTGLTASATLTVTQAPTTTTVTVSPASPTFGKTVTFTAHVAPSGPNNSGVNPTGTVSFFLNGSSSPIEVVPLSATGKASFKTAALAAGANTVKAVYSGDTNFLGSSSSATATVGCTTTIVDPHGPVHPGSGSTCVIGGTVTGAIVLGTGQSLDLEGVTVTGSITAIGAGAFRMCASSATAVTVEHATSFVVIGDAAAGCTSNTIKGALTLLHNTHGVQAIGNTVGGAVNLVGNSGSGPFPGDTAPNISGNHP